MVKTLDNIDTQLVEAGEHIRAWNISISAVAQKLTQLDTKKKELLESLAKLDDLVGKLSGEEISRMKNDFVREERDLCDAKLRWQSFLSACSKLSANLDKAKEEISKCRIAAETGGVSFAVFDKLVDWVIRNRGIVETAMKNFMDMPLDEISSAVANLRRAKFVLEYRMKMSA